MELKAEQNFCTNDEEAGLVERELELSFGEGRHGGVTEAMFPLPERASAKASLRCLILRQIHDVGLLEGLRDFAVRQSQRIVEILIPGHQLRGFNSGGDGRFRET